MLQIVGKLAGRNAFQIKLQTARQNRDRYLLRVCGCQHELDMRGWFFQRFQQGVETMRGEHMDFIDQVNLVATTGGCIRDVLK